MLYHKITCTFHGHIHSKIALSQSALEFANWRSIRVMRDSVIYVPKCQACSNFPFLGANVPMNVLKACQLFEFARQKAQQFFNCFSKEFFNFSIFQLCSIFANSKNIWAILENLARETEKFNFDICKVLLRKKLANVKSLSSFSMKNYSASVKVIFFIFLYAVCKKAYLEKHTSYTPSTLLKKHT